MRTLILMRHAEAGYASPGQADFDRPLTPRGQNDAKNQGAVLRDQNLIPDMVLCSSANRTKLTCACVQSAMKDDLPLDFSVVEQAHLYNASHDTLLEAARGIDGRIDIALILAHNPGIHELASQLAGGHHHDLQNGYPPATMAIFEFSGRDWFEVSPETLTLKQVVIPSKSLL